ncbi:uncharacterized protein EV420DRAFT_1563231, partial [Desarmillaria tabescens]
MVKRPSITSSSVSEYLDTPPSKKTRVDRDDGSRSRRKGEAGARNDASEENGNNGDVDTYMDYDDEKFEKTYKDRILASLKRETECSRGVAEYGIIEYIEMHQFMCHRYLS